MARGNVKHQLSEAQGPSEQSGRNPVVNPDAMIFQEGSSEGVASSLTKGLAPYTCGNIIGVDPLESGRVEKPISKRSQPITVSVDSCWQRHSAGTIRGPFSGSPAFHQDPYVICGSRLSPSQD